MTEKSNVRSRRLRGWPMATIEDDDNGRRLEDYINSAQIFSEQTALDEDNYIDYRSG